MPDNLREMVIGFISGNREVLGSRLGYFLKCTFPEWDFKAEFGTLRALIEAELPDSLEHVGKRGGNDIYRNRMFKDDAINPSGDERELSGADRDLWALFSNPNRTGSIFVRNNLLFARYNQASASDSEMELPRISLDEYTEFLPRAWALCSDGIPEDIHSRIDAIITENPSQWSAVLNFLRKTKHLAVARKLEELRISYVIEQFRLRLQKLEIQPDTVQTLVGQLLESRSRRDATKQAKPASRISVATTPNDLQVALLRQIAKIVIDDMTAEQILALNLPLGLVANKLIANV